MSANPRLTKKSPSRIKRAALELFARRGVKAVTVREISAAAGQKNSASIGYHFGSKEALIKELVVDGARLIDDRRNSLLDQAEADGGVESVYEVVEMLVYPSIGLSKAGENDVFNRFLTSLVFDDRATFMSALEDRWNSGYQRCLEHLRRLMPDISEEEQGQRFVFIESYIGGVLSIREARLMMRSHEQSMWEKPESLEHLVRSIVAILEMPSA